MERTIINSNSMLPTTYLSPGCKNACGCRLLEVVQPVLLPTKMGTHINVLKVSPPFIHLPPELVHYIFNLAAASLQHSSLNICLVSSWVCHIALPHLFHTVILSNY